MKKTVIFLIIAALTASCFFLMKDYDKKNGKRTALLSAAAHELNELDIKKAEAERILASGESECVEKTDRSMTITFFFDTLSDDLIEVIYPLMNEYGFKGTIVMKNGSVPGDVGCISRRSFDMLIQSGWDAALGGSDDIDMAAENAPEELVAYIDRYIEELSARAIARPTTYCFDEGEYSKRFDRILKERGFVMLRHYGEEGSIYGGFMPKDGVYRIGARVIRAAATSAQKDVIEARRTRTSIGISANAVMDTVNDALTECTKEKYGIMLEYIKNTCQEAKVLTASELYEYHKKTLDEHGDSILGYEKRAAEARQSLSEIEIHKKEIYDRLEKSLN